MATEFCETPIGTVFLLDGEDLLTRPTNARALGRFRKVAADAAAHIAHRREAKWYVPADATVVQIEQRDKGIDPPVSSLLHHRTPPTSRSPADC